MHFKPFYWVGAIALLVLVLYSCRKDNNVTDTIPTEDPTENPTENPQGIDFELTAGDETFNDGNHTTSIIGPKEVNEIIKGTSLIQRLIQETLMQVFLSHNANPLFLQSQREACSCDGGTVTDCGCPFVINTDPTVDVNDPISYPAELILRYRDATTCSSCQPVSDVLTGSGTSPLQIFGEITVEISGPTGIGQEITISPSDDFTIDGFEVDATFIKLTKPNGSNFYTLDIGDVVVTDPSVVPSETTTFIDIGGFGEGLTDGRPNITALFFTDNGVTHDNGDITNGYGYLDDEFRLMFHDLKVKCSNLIDVTLTTGNNIEGGDGLFYDFYCPCIKKGTVIMDIPNTKDDKSYNYSYTGLDANGDETYDGTCDDLIEVCEYQLSLQGNTATTRSSDCYEASCL